MRFPTLIAAATLLLAACGSAGDDAAAPSAQASAGISITGDDGEEVQVAGGDEALAALPPGFTAYPGAQVTSSTAIATGTGGGVILVMQTDDPVADVIEFYTTQATAAGVRLDGTVTTGSNTLIGGEGEDGLAFSASAADGPDGTIVQLTVGRD
ncbi:hypothetical protein [Alteraurantiacibacter buctensis]|uniref:DUF4402 domain-containing protein n=1 Tax=Alteraurantiacibacter buctensis TaxID=1503981 RepID=A0A844Z0W2_9SPHN|nr:hypothetical protein [Alteraurantiacibacter buctensis]MXO72037.1 hypothetical protein [Alteraurantiacibacter buctensis]